MIARIAAVTMVFLAIIAMPFTTIRAQEPASASRSVWDGVYAKEQAERGRALYKGHCEKRHGASLEGGDEAPPRG